MSEVFFILTVIYVAYVVYAVVDDEDSAAPSKKAANPGAVAFKQPPTPQKAPVTENKTEPTLAENSTEINVEPPAEVTQTKINKLAAPKIELRTVVMKNPKTGEEAKVATNYRMVKRWVKEALVTEGLLDKIYKNTELDDAAKITIAKALSIIKAMDKYKP